MSTHAMQVVCEIFSENGHDWEAGAAIVSALAARLAVSHRAAELLLTDLMEGRWLDEATVCYNRSDQMVVERAYAPNANLREWMAGQPEALVPRGLR